MENPLLLISKKIHKIAGYEIQKTKIDKPVQLHQYGSNTSFDYDSYKEIQIEGNKRKLNSVWASEENIKFISNYLQLQIENIQFGLCHGTRRGLEQKWFKAYIGCDVIGTEISDTASEFEDTIEWDFHDVKDNWIGAVDFIYSNSFDHSYDPESCINRRADCLKKGGVCVIEHSSDDEKSTALDPFGAKIQIMPYLLATWLRGKCGVVDILDAPVVPKSQSYVKFIVLQKR